MNVASIFGVVAILMSFSPKMDINKLEKMKARFVVVLIFHSPGYKIFDTGFGFDIYANMGNK